MTVDSIFAQDRFPVHLSALEAIFIKTSNVGRGRDSNLVLCRH